MKTLEFKQWSEFRSWIDADRQIMPVYWRGQRDPAWPLASGFEREILNSFGGDQPGASQLYPYAGRYTRADGQIWEEGFYAGMRDRYLHVFKRAAEGLRGPNPSDLSTDQWWALGRHHGLVTPLLDWSESPYIAAFFPLVELLQSMRSTSGTVSYSGSKIALYRLFHNSELEGTGLRVLRPTVQELVRMHGQRGVFTWLESEVYFELQGFLNDSGRGELLTQFLISDQAVMDGIRDLRHHGIDHRLLFPDLHGAAQYGNTRWDVF